MPLAGNLIAPTILAASWSLLFRPWLPGEAVLLHLAIGLLVGIAQTGRQRTQGRWADLALIAENVFRTIALAGLYGLCDGSAITDLPAFMAEPAHAFLIATSVTIGVILGLAHLDGLRHLNGLRVTTERLAEVSQWSMNASHLQQAITDERSLTPVRRDRAVLFADIRGFTAWSENRKPEEVLDLLSHFYAAAERTWLGCKPVKRKFTGDEIMLVFADTVDAARTALAMRDASRTVLGTQGLGLGIGLHHGALIEGLIGSRNLRAFDVLGDTVNTGKRVCDHAKAGEILCTFTFFETAPDRLVVSDSHAARAKGKSSPVILAQLLGVRETPPAVPATTRPVAPSSSRGMTGRPD
jgi:class 3 adenylate cyclase